VEYALGKFFNGKALPEMTAKGEISVNSIAKTIAFWVALLVTAILLYNVFTNRPTGKDKEVNFSKFVDEVTNKNVKTATIVDADVTGEMVSGEKFKTTIPVEYPAIYDKLAASGVDYKIDRPAQGPWLAALISWAPFLFIIGFWIYFMRNFQKKGTLRTGFTDASNLGKANVVQLDPDVARAFPNSRSVNDALRLIIQLKDIPGTA
jgi:cell division protease FtsH